jgi:hypothetical protein
VIAAESQRVATINLSVIRGDPSRASVISAGVGFPALQKIGFVHPRDTARLPSRSIHQINQPRPLGRDRTVDLEPKTEVRQDSAERQKGERLAYRESRLGISPRWSRRGAHHTLGGSLPDCVVRLSTEELLDEGVDRGGAHLGERNVHCHERRTEESRSRSEECERVSNFVNRAGPRRRRAR